MKHLIYKDAVLAIIEQLKDEAIDMEDKARWFLSASLAKRIDTLEVKEYSEKNDGFLGKELKMIDDEIARLEKLKVKEVDLEREIQAFAKMDLEPLEIYDANIGISITMSQLYKCARHFFELGMQVSNKAQK